MPGFPTALPLAPVLLVSFGELVNFVPLGLIVIANLAARGQDRRLSPNWYWIVLAASGAGVVLLGVLTLPTSVGSGLGYVAGGVAMGAMALAPARQLAARVLPVDPESVLDATAVGFTLVIAGAQIGLQLSTNVLAQVAAGPAETPLDQVLEELPLLFAALLGVGLGFRRGPREVLERLAVVRPRLWQVVVGLACAGVFYAFALGAELLQQRLTPGTAARVGSATETLYRGIDTPIGILTIALVPAICEECLFRGALQPRLGLIWTAIVFALLHTQYGLSIDELAVVVLAFGLGLLWRFTNTTTTMICHATYNAATALQLAQVFLWPALAIESALVLAALLLVTQARVGSVGGRPQ